MARHITSREAKERHVSLSSFLQRGLRVYIRLARSHETINPGSLDKIYPHPHLPIPSVCPWATTLRSFCGFLLCLATVLTLFPFVLFLLDSIRVLFTFVCPLSFKSSFYLVTSFRHVFSSPSIKIFQFILHSPFSHLSSFIISVTLERYHVLEVVCMISLELFARLILFYKQRVSFLWIFFPSRFVSLSCGFFNFLLYLLLFFFSFSLKG